MMLLQIKVSSIIKPFFRNKGHINREKIILISDNETITDSSGLAETFNSRYINIAEKTFGRKPSHFARDINVSHITQAIDLIV